MQRLFVVLHDTLGSYLRNALHEGGANVVALMHALEVEAFLPPFSLLWWWIPLLSFFDNFCAMLSS
jgi:hypothetical protein